MTINELIERLQFKMEEQKSYQVTSPTDIFVDVIPEYSFNPDMPIVSLIY